MTVKKEFVPYQESLELKELGFDEPCFGNWQDMKEETPWFSKSYTDNQNQYYGQLCSAPTFSQAFRWFREKYSLCIVIKPIDDKKLELGYNLTKNGLIMGAYTSHEEAELACLRKLIQIVKVKTRISTN